MMSSRLDRPTAADGIGESFDTVVLPHLEAARRLARYLMRDADVAEDAVQEASLRAFRYFRTFVSGDGRAWFLSIVRNTCYGWRRQHYRPPTESFDDELHSSAQPQPNPETLLLQTDDAAVIARALHRLPDHYHQLLVLRELEGLSYRELSDVIGIPMGTVMSRLSRARGALRSALGSKPRQTGISSKPDEPRTPSDPPTKKPAIGVAGENGPLVCAPDGVHDACGPSAEHVKSRACLRLPDAHGAVVRSRQHLPVIPAPHDRPNGVLVSGEHT